MPKVAINLVRYNQPKEMLKQCIDAILAQDYADFELTLTENGSADTETIEYFKKNYNHSKFKIANNHKNLGYAGAHNKFFHQSNAEFVMPINPDATLQPGFLKNIVAVFEDPKVAAATGKMLRPQKDSAGNHIIDGTGVIIEKSRRARERGQNDIDFGQYDKNPEDRKVFAVSGTAPLYRKSALEAVRLGDEEYFDPDFFMYWEDVDLGWRLRLAGFEARYVPEALLYHSRVAGQSKGGYKNPLRFYKHHKKLPQNIRRWNWRNHLFMIVKNDFGWNFFAGLPDIILREAAMFVWIAVFETKTLTIIPSFFGLLPKIWAKRQIIQANRKVSSEQISVWFK